MKKCLKQRRLPSRAYLLSAAQSIVLCLYTILFLLTLPSQAYAASNPKYASIVIDAKTGFVLHQRHADKSLHPASLAKMMTLLLTFEALDNKRIKLYDSIYISRHAASMIPSKLGLSAGSSIRVEDAIYALVTKSANDIAVSLAEKISGTEHQFALDMTKKARAIGMSKTVFTNASGLHHKNQVTTARDIATLARYIIIKHPRYYQYFSTRTFTYKGDTFSNHNRLMDSYNGMDGLKTGYINASGFNLAASAVRNDQRIIGIVFGGRTSRSRNSHMKTLLDRGFENLHHLLVATRQAPIPERKPVLLALAASYNSIEPALGQQDDEEDIESSSKFATLNSQLQSKAFSNIIGQGDIDPAMSKRIETGLMAMAALKKGVLSSVDTGKLLLKPVSFTPSSQTLGVLKKEHNWSIQVGAFTSRDKAKTALIKAKQKLPQPLSRTKAAIAPFKTTKGLLYRGRLTGLNKEQALNTCRYLRECMLIAP